MSKIYLEGVEPFFIIVDMGNQEEFRVEIFRNLVLDLNLLEMITKEKLKSYINEFPEEMTIEEVIEKLIFIDKLETRIQESKNNEVIGEEEVKTEIEKWFE